MTLLSRSMSAESPHTLRKSATSEKFCPCHIANVNPRDEERARDEKNIERLYKDIANGGLRRKRLAEFDLSDSDDDIEERRRRKQREFAKMRRHLLEDENIGKIGKTSP